MYDSRFGYGQSSGAPGYLTLWPRSRRAATIAELYALWQPDVQEAETIAGRPLTARELAQGVEGRPDSRSEQARILRRHSQRAELNPTPVDNRSVEQKQADFWAEKAREEAEAKMSPTERRAAESAREAAAAERRAAELAKRTEIMSTTSYKNIRDRLDALLFMGKFDSTLDAAIYDELVHQSELLERTLDEPAVHNNVKQLQQAVFNHKSAEHLKLLAATDIVKQQTSAWGSGLNFDRPPFHFVEGGTEYVRLIRDGKSVSIRRDEFDGKTEEQLVQRHFPAPAGTGDPVAA